MRLSRNTDYSLRILIFLALREDKLATTSEIATAYGISRGHLKQLIHRLGRLGYIETLPGRSGGMLLGMDPSGIRVGELVRRVEDTLALADCFPDPELAGRPCLLDGSCPLKAALNAALEAFFRELDQYTVADLAASPTLPLRGLLRGPTNVLSRQRAVTVPVSRSV